MPLTTAMIVDPMASRAAQIQSSTSVIPVRTIAIAARPTAPTPTRIAVDRPWGSS
jgi:hypothetical protein